MTKTLREGVPGVEAITSRTAAENESQSRHTPGPWRIEPPTKGCPNPLIIGADGDEVAVVYPGGVAGDAGWDEHPAMPNARLTVAAPDMLQALRDVAAACLVLNPATDEEECRWCCHRQGHDDDCTMQGVLAAIAKAEEN